MASGTAITALALNGNVSVPALTVTAGSIYANTSSANIANVNASNVYVTGNATVTQIITAANLNATANIYTTGPITTAGNFTAPYVNSANAQHAFGMNAANILSTGTAILTYLGGNGGQINLDIGGILFAGGAATFANLINFNSGLQIQGSSQIQTQNGTQAAPSYSFTGSLGTGMYCNATNQLSLSAAGTQVVQLSSFSSTVNTDLTVNGNVIISSGKRLVVSSGPIYSNNNFIQAGTFQTSVGNAMFPTICCYSDLTTGMWFPSSGKQVGLSANNTSVALFTPTVATIYTDLAVTGNLTISGNTTTVNTTQLTVADPVLVVNSGSLASAGGMYIQGNTLTTQANVVVAYNPTSKFIEMYNTNSAPTVNTFTNTGYANIRANTITLDSSLLAVSLMANYPSDQGTGLGSGYVASSNSKSTYVSLLSNGKIVAMAFNPDSDNTTDPGSFSVFGTMQSQDLLVSNVAGSSTVLIRTCDGGAFDAIGTTHIISIQGAILKQNPATVNSNIIGSGTGQAGTAFNNIMGTLYISTSNLMLGANAKAGHATISVLKLNGAAEMDIMPVSVHQSTLCNVFTVGKSSVSDNGNVVITTDSDCAITWQFYGSAY